MKSKYDRNLVVIGAGAAGLVSAYIAAAVKAKVTLVESHKMGGDCLNYGCVPSKTLIRSAKSEYLQTLHRNIYAAGDVAGPYQFTHVAAHQAWYASVNALFGQFKKFKADYRVVPWTIFIDPEVARVGLNEREAKEKEIPFEVTRYDIAELDRAITENATEGFRQGADPAGQRQNPRHYPLLSHLGGSQ